MTSRLLGMAALPLLVAVALVGGTGAPLVNVALPSQGTRIVADTQYSDQVRDYLTSLKRQYKFYSVDDQDFLNKLQFAADWLSERKILPSKVTVRNHLAKL